MAVLAAIGGMLFVLRGVLVFSERVRGGWFIAPTVTGAIAPAAGRYPRLNAEDLGYAEEKDTNSAPKFPRSPELPP